MLTTSMITILNVNDGEKGDQGNQGISVLKVTPEYRLSDSNTELTGDETNPKYQWSETMPEVGDGQYLWTRQRNDLSEGNPTYSDAVCSVVISGLVSKVDKVDQSITDKIWKTDIETQINEYDQTTVSVISDTVSDHTQDIEGLTNRV